MDIRKNHSMNVGWFFVLDNPSNRRKNISPTIGKISCQSSEKYCEKIFFVYNISNVNVKRGVLNEKL